VSFPFVTWREGIQKIEQGQSHQQCKNNDNVRWGRGGHGKCDRLATPLMQANDNRQLGTQGMADKGIKGLRSEWDYDGKKESGGCC
jgi:hypothetical protein